MYVMVKAEHVVTGRIILERACEAVDLKQAASWIGDRIYSNESVMFECNKNEKVLIPGNIVKDCIFTVSDVVEVEVSTDFSALCNM